MFPRPPLRSVICVFSLCFRVSLVTGLFIFLNNQLFLALSFYTIVPFSVSFLLSVISFLLLLLWVCFALLFLGSQIIKLSLCLSPTISI